MPPTHEQSRRRKFSEKTGALLVLAFLVVFDGSGALKAVADPSFKATVLAGNIQPEVSLIPDQTIAASSVLSAVPFTVSDPETPADKLSITGSSSDTALVSHGNIVFDGSGASRTVTVTPTPHKSGVTAITIYVTDEAGGQATVNFLLNVVPARRAPTLDPLPDLIIDGDAPAQTVNLTGISLGSLKEGRTLKVTAVSSNPALIADPTVDYVSPNSNGTLSFTPAAGVNGEASISVTVDDGSAIDSTVTRSFAVTVLPLNSPPDVSAIPDHTVDVNSVFTAPFSVADPETPADQLLLTGSSSDPALVPNANILFNGSGANRTITVFPAPNRFGATTITIFVKDKNGHQATASFLLTVAPPDHAPTLDPLPDIVINEDAPVRITLTGIAPDAFIPGQNLRLTAVSSDSTLVPDPVVNYMSPDSSGTLSIVPVANANGIAVITVTVDDGDPTNPSFSRSFTVTVFPVNDVPTISAILDQTIAENTIAASIPFVIADVETPLVDLVLSVFSADTALVPSANIVFVGSGANRTLLIRPAPDRFGTTKVTITVTDSDGGVGVSAFLLTVRPINTPPTISSVATQFTLQDQATSPIGITVGDAETGAADLKLTASSSNTALVPDENFRFTGTATDRVLVIIPAAGQRGTTRIFLTVSDGIAVSSETFELIVAAAPPIVITQPISQSVMPGELVTFSVGVTGSNPLFYQWRLNGSDIPGATESQLVLSNVTINLAGDYSVAVSNAAGLTTSQIATLSVAAPPQFSIQPKSQIIGTGSPLSLDVSTFGDGPFIYQWRLNGVNIPGATNATFDILKVQPADAGTYSCAVANRYGAVNSAIAPVIAQVDDLPMTDSFADRKRLFAPAGIGRSPNLGASREPREPKHAGKVGGKSMWIAWIAPSDGIATFNTAGSTFDTLLGIYTGSDLGSLTTVTRDEDQGGFLTSGAQFNARAGTEYQIAVDSFAGREGIILLKWNLELTRELLPEIIAQPQSQTVGSGATVGFTVGARGLGLSYQWFFNDTVVPGATEPTYVISQVQSANLGSYRARVFRGRRFVDSAGAVLQLGSNADAQDIKGVAATDKFADAFSAAQFLPIALQSANPSSTIRRTSPGLARGFTGTQNFSTVGSTKEEGEPIHCDEIGGASQWFSYQAPANGPLTITTDGSDFDTVLAVYLGPGTDFASLQLVACDNNSGVDGKTSLVQFPVTVGTTYYIAVDGVNAATGNVRLHYSLDVPFHLSAARIENGQFRLSLNAGLSGAYVIEASTNLSNWFPIQTVQATSGVVEFSDTNSTNFPCLFYRVIPAQ